LLDQGLLNESRNRLIEDPIERQKRIMVVDDEPFNVEALVQILKMLGITNEIIIDTCYNG
jgi:PleD family two-component response regulator